MLQQRVSQAQVRSDILVSLRTQVWSRSLSHCCSYRSIARSQEGIPVFHKSFPFSSGGYCEEQVHKEQELPVCAYSSVAHEGDPSRFDLLPALQATCQRSSGMRVVAPAGLASPWKTRRPCRHSGSPDVRPVRRHETSRQQPRGRSVALDLLRQGWRQREPLLATATAPVSLQGRKYRLIESSLLRWVTEWKKGREESKR
mmetsp:Transcript_37144/g.116903  ORF Transcript_37144/g.116903 Transcript_37144/m.116903 type:complete len:200 (-) Transcript_37144:889-1488(-)